MFEQEIWKDLKGYEGLYQVSNLGRIKSLYFSKEKIMKPILTGTCKYYTIGLAKNKKRKTHLIHRLVAETFLENPNNLPEVNHKDENKLNNRIDNLEWCNHEYNMHYGNCLKKVSEKQHRKKINQYDLNGKFIKQWDSVSEIRKKLNVTNIANCCLGRYKQSNGFIWRYVDDDN